MVIRRSPGYRYCVPLRKRRKEKEAVISHGWNTCHSSNILSNWILNRTWVQNRLCLHKSEKMEAQPSSGANFLLLSLWLTGQFWPMFEVKYSQQLVFIQYVCHLLVTMLGFITHEKIGFNIFDASFDRMLLVFNMKKCWNEQRELNKNKIILWLLENISEINVFIFYLHFIHSCNIYGDTGQFWPVDIYFKKKTSF